MSEKRFKLNDKGSFILEDGEPLKPLGNVVHKLNEQQATINKQLGQIIELQDKYRILEFNHSRLEKRNKAQYEKIGEQQATLSALKDIFKDIITYSEWDSKKPYCSLRIAVDKKTYYKIREILNE